MTSFFRPPPTEGDTPYEVYVHPSTANYVEEYTISTLNDLLLECITLGLLLFNDSGTQSVLMNYLARALGYSDDDSGVPSSCIDEIMERTRKDYSRPTSTHKPSMLVDVENRRPTEVEVIFGNVVRMGRKFGVPLPVSNGPQYLSCIND
jgi:2-dehydropantoate 2-reductase